MSTTTARPQGLPPAYDPSAVEQPRYRQWLDGGYFAPNPDAEGPPFVIIQPPPNVTGELHLGHAQRAAVEDALTRWRRMSGDAALWLPGVDHAGIATQVVVERELAEEGLTRHDLGREKFVERMWDWVKRYRGRIQTQHYRLGVSCDWSRECFTLDPGPSKAVRHTFVNLYRKGLIYRGERIINWCPRCATALSDLEVEYRDVDGKLYYVHYPAVDGDRGITVATTRPETMMGDTGVAVHPDDPRYKSLHGKNVLLPVLNRPIPVVGDAAVDPEFGTGALKVTPGHAPADFDIGRRHGLPVVSAIALDGTMTADAGPYEGMERFACREAVVEQLQAEGLLEKVEENRHAVGHCQRCRQVVEPLVSKQWFMSMEPLARPALEAVRSGAVRIVPERFVRVYENWMENIRDWCLSRQLWWGHRIPVWYCDACDEPIVEYEDANICPKCGGTRLTQDPDVLDTWFSSGLWPHSTLGWPDQTDDFRTYYPGSVMETGHDILFFWVARMIMLGIENTGQVPFHTVYLSGLIRDPEGVKMSKTRGNVIDPIEAIETYGADALRFAVTAGNSPGNDARVGPDKLEAARNFSNKIWNATRFVLRSMDDAPAGLAWEGVRPSHIEDRWLLSRLSRLTGRVTRALEEYQLGEAEQAVHDFLWNDFCDWYIEASKVRLQAGDASPVPVLAHVLETTLRLLHPFMPFITEELWQHLRERLPGRENAPPSIMVAPYPQEAPDLLDDEAEAAFNAVVGIIRAVRYARAEFRIEPRRRLDALIAPRGLRSVTEAEAPAIRALARVDLQVLDDEAALPLDGALSVVVGEATLSIPLGGVVDMAAERQRLAKEQQQTEAVLSKLEARLADATFRERAPEDVVEREEARRTNLRERTARIQDLLSRLPA